MKKGTKRKDREIYRQLLRLWAAENPVKTQKLQFLLLTNAILISAAVLSGTLFSQLNRLLFSGGAILCFVWTLSIGRTLYFQKIWQMKINRIAEKYPDNRHFRIHLYRDDVRILPFFLRIAGGCSAKYYLLGTPVFFFLAWTSLFVISFF